MALFFTADTHFGDHRTLNIQRRSFTSVAEMDTALLANWNAVVGPDDEVWHLGDVARKPADVPDLLARLNGTKHLVRGNNDPPGTGEAPGWTSVQHYAELTVDGVLLVLCHYPFRSWNGQHRRSVNLHGHSHGKLRPLPRQHDVGVDARGFLTDAAHVILPANVSDDVDRLTAHAADFIHQLGQRAFAPRGQHQLRAALDGQPGRRQADPRRRAGYYDDLIDKRLQPDIHKDPIFTTVGW